MMQTRYGFGKLLLAIPLLLVAGNGKAQDILPDNSLGAESSIATPLSPQQVQIDGGAIRGTNLFHSFLEFNINEGNAAYFANSAGIANIFSRVTGSNPSHLLGTLGVSGDANLFFLNPNGILFGPNAQLDITGSFVASTANRFVFANGRQFGAIAPENAPLLTVTASAPVGLRFEGRGGAIVNAGDLEVGQNLTLVGDTLVNTGTISASQVTLATIAPDPNSSSLSQLLANVEDLEALGLSATNAGTITLAGSEIPIEAGDIAFSGSLTAERATLAAANNLTLVESTLQTSGHLNLLARDTVRVRDSLAVPFLAQAGGNLRIQGDRHIDILALNHPQTPFQSGGNLSLVSNGVISGDAHFTAGGRFAVLNLAGEPGEFVSLYDPIISSESDVVLGNYTGVALKVESKGSITTGDIRITGADTSLTPNSDPDIDILRSSPALILRAGVDELRNPPTTSIPIYNNDFSRDVQSEWSDTSVDRTPLGDRPFLGQFAEETVSLNLRNLPPHRQVTVAFDLFIIQSWDGNDTNPNGFDIWQFDVTGIAEPLIYTTFSNFDGSINMTNYPQSYPDRYDPSALINNPAFTGAAEVNSLGYLFGIDPNDSVYRLNVPFQHTDSTLQLNFSGLDLEPTGESWGLANVSVTVDSISLGDFSPGQMVGGPISTLPGTVSPGTISTGNISTANGPVIFSATDDIRHLHNTRKTSKIEI